MKFDLFPSTRALLHLVAILKQTTVAATCITKKAECFCANLLIAADCMDHLDEQLVPI
jgi:hypothetical protein